MVPPPIPPSRTVHAEAPGGPANKCDYCPGRKCCTYITQRIPAPRSNSDFDHMLWQISHAGVQFYKDSDGWFLVFLSRCSHLQADGRCGIYSQRPQVCRDYSNDYCEFDAPAEDGFELFFTCYESLLSYCRRRFPRWDGD